MRWWTASLLALLVLAVGCPQEEEVDPSPTRTSGIDAGPVEEPAPDAGAEVAEFMIPTSILSEESFKKLHEIKKEAAPPPKGRMVSIDDGRAYLSMPKSGAGSPGVIVIHEWWGLNGHIKHWADRLAEAGYTALAVDLFNGRTTEDPDVAVELVRDLNPDYAMGVLREAQAYLADAPDVRASRIGVIGWCFGGAWALRAAMRLENLDAVVMYYGRLVQEPEKLKQIDAPLLAVFGNEDTSIPPESVDRFADALRTAGVDYRILRYDAPHAFANPSQESYDTYAAREAWGEVQTFLAEHLKPGGGNGGGGDDGDSGADGGGRTGSDGGRLRDGGPGAGAEAAGRGADAAG